MLQPNSFMFAILFVFRYLLYNFSYYSLTTFFVSFFILIVFIHVSFVIFLHSNLYTFHVFYSSIILFTASLYLSLGHSVSHGFPFRLPLSPSYTIYRFKFRFSMASLPRTSPSPFISSVSPYSPSPAVLHFLPFLPINLPLSTPFFSHFSPLCFSIPLLVSPPSR